MTTTNIYQGLNTEKSSSRVLKAPGGGSSNIFGHYQEEEDKEKKQQQERERRLVEERNAQAAGDRDRQNGENQQSCRDEYAANRARNAGTGAPFATSESEVSTPSRQNKPSATHAEAESFEYQTPQQRQAQNPNKGQNTFNNLFGESQASEGKANRQKAQVSAASRNILTGNGFPAHSSFTPSKNCVNVSTHNPVTWQAYSNYDPNQDKPKHVSRFENSSSNKPGSFNPITGQSNEEEAAQRSSTKVKAPPGGKSSITF